jgi:hypothetical protein
MRFGIGLVVLAFFVFACSSENGERVETERSTRLDEFIRIPTDDEGNVDPEKLPRIEFAEDHYKYDTLQEGERVEHSFTFTNTGSSSLLIASVKSSCGCTVADYPKDPVAPGEKGEILATYNSTDKKGPQINEITIYSNAYPSQYSLTLSGFVLPKD